MDHNGAFDSMIAFLGSIAAASVLGSWHCAAMCGGLSTIASGGAARPQRAAQLSYQAGRLVAYAVLGSAAGALGSAANVAGSAVGFADIATVVAASFMIVWGLAQLLPLWARRRGSASLNPPRFRWLSDAFSRALYRISQHPPVLRGALMGVATGVLPCGFLYAFVVLSAGTGSFAGGALTMAAFWLGTVPALLGFGVFARKLGSSVSRKLPAFGALVLVVLGLGSLFVRASGAPPANDPEHGPNCPMHPHKVTVQVSP